MKKIVIIPIGLIVLLFAMIAYGKVKSLEVFGYQRGILEKIRERTQMNIEEFERNKLEFQNLLEKNQIEFRNTVFNRREELKKIIEENKKELKNRLKIIKNEQKQKIVERIYEQINNLNERMIIHYLDILEKLEKVLVKIETQAAKAKINEKDISLVEITIAQAKTLIENAREIIKNQSEKIYYPAEINSEGSLRIEVGKIRQQLHQDLKNVELMVKTSKEAVKEAAIQLVQIPEID